MIESLEEASASVRDVGEKLTSIDYDNMIPYDSVKRELLLAIKGTVECQRVNALAEDLSLEK